MALLRSHAHPSTKKQELELKASEPWSKRGRSLTEETVVRKASGKEEAPAEF